MLPRLILEAKRQAEKLSRYCIMPTHSAFLLWRYDDEWKPIMPFGSRGLAEDYLILKLPVISHPPDIVRETPTT